MTQRMCLGVQGYLKCSVQIVGPGDKLKIHNEEEELQKEKQMEKSNSGDMGSLCLMPPSIKKVDYLSFPVIF